MEKSEKDSMDITEFKEDLEKFTKAFERIQKLSSWMTTVALASLGLTLTLLFQIRSKAVVPNKYLAAGVLFVFVISALLGFYGKFRYELQEYERDMRIGARGLLDMLRKASKEFSGPDEIAKLSVVAGERFKEMMNDYPGKTSKYTLIWPVIGQGITLSLGLILFSVYITIYLFTSTK